MLITTLGPVATVRSRHRRSEKLLSDTDRDDEPLNESSISGITRCSVNKQIKCKNHEFRITSSWLQQGTSARQRTNAKSQILHFRISSYFESYKLAIVCVISVHLFYYYTNQVIIWSHRLDCSHFWRIFWFHYIFSTVTRFPGRGCLQLDCPSSGINYYMLHHEGIWI